MLPQHKVLVRWAHSTRACTSALQLQLIGQEASGGPGPQRGPLGADTGYPSSGSCSQSSPGLPAAGPVLVAVVDTLVEVEGMAGLSVRSRWARDGQFSLHRHEVLRLLRHVLGLGHG
jgi:hypothetical protein